MRPYETTFGPSWPPEDLFTWVRVDLRSHGDSHMRQSPTGGYPCVVISPAKSLRFLQRSCVLYLIFRV